MENKDTISGEELPIQHDEQPVVKDTKAPETKEVKREVNKIAEFDYEILNKPISSLPTNVRINSRKVLEEFELADIEDMQSNHNFRVLLESTKMAPNGMNKIDASRVDDNIKTIEKPEFKVDAEEASDDSLLLLIDENVNGISLNKVILWNSGIVLYHRPPTNDDIVKFERIRANTLITGAIETGGAILSNMDALVMNGALDIMGNLFYGSNVKGIKSGKFGKLMELIRTSDLQLIYASLQDSMKIGGHELTLPCTNASEKDIKCKGVLNKTISYRNLVRPISSRFDDKIKSYFANANLETNTVKEVKAYQEELINKDWYPSEPISIGGVDTYLKDPNLVTYREHSGNWLSSLITNLDNVISEKTDSEKIMEMEQYIKFSGISLYTHLFNKVGVGGVIRGNTSFINKALVSITKDEEKSKTIFKGIYNFLEKGSLYLIGTNNYKCDTCMKRQDSNVDYIVPINIANSFLQLTREIALGISSREESPVS